MPSRHLIAPGYLSSGLARSAKTKLRFPELVGTAVQADGRGFDYSANNPTHAPRDLYLVYLQRGAAHTFLERRRDFLGAPGVVHFIIHENAC